MGEQFTPPNTNLPAVDSAGGAMVQAEEWSAWVDGELPPEAIDTLCAAGDDSAPLSLDAWHRYHLIGDVLRATAETTFVCSDGALNIDGSRRAAQHIMAQAKLLPPAPAMPGLPLAVLPTTQRPQAANDGVFRWKMASGFASVIALVSLAWGMGGLTGGGNAGPTVAQIVPAASTAVAVADPVTVTTHQQDDSAVLVTTAHGQELRDVRLDQLLLAHRQAGGATALQVPAGFLRNATFDPAQR